MESQEWSWANRFHPTNVCHVRGQPAFPTASAARIVLPKMDAVLEHTYTSPSQHHSTLRKWSEDGKRPQPQPTHSLIVKCEERETQDMAPSQTTKRGTLSWDVSRFLRPSDALSLKKWAHISQLSTVSVRIAHLLWCKSTSTQHCFALSV